MHIKRYLASFIVISVIAVAGATVANATHSWGNYHWARTANPFTLELGDNVSSAWDSYLSGAAGDWSASSVLDMVVKTGLTSPKTCKGTTGRVEVCNSKYGNNGWLGIAQIWISGDHITKGVVKMNDTYFNTSKYNTPAWRAMVMCQEIGHTIGLDHQDENFNNANLGTCMDYTSDPSDNQHPNAHDYEELELIYAHPDNYTTVIATTDTGDTGGTGGGGKGGKGRPEGVGQDIDPSNPSAWGQAVRDDANSNHSVYVRDMGNGEKVFTFVTWAE